jgi:GntR family transcriptional repressor for pyruvate dehydrogenase complex
MNDLFKALNTARLSEQIVEQIETLIVSGQLKSGDRLPAERDLCERFGVSRTVIREATRSLQEKGLVAIRPGVGTFIYDGMSGIMRQSLERMVLIDKQQGLENLIQVREMLEPAIAAIAAHKAEPADIAALLAAIKTMDESMHDVEAFVAADHEFHLALAHATKNQLIVYLIDSIVDSLTQQRRRTFLGGKGGPMRGQEYHKRICAAIRAHDGDLARALMLEHLQQVRDDTDFDADEP